MKLSTEYIYRAKKKTELLLIKLIEKYDISEIISDKYKFRIDFDKFVRSKYWLLHKEKKDRLGLAYIARTIPCSIEEWLFDNFKDYMCASNIYDKFCKSAFIEKADLRILNEIYRNIEKL